MASIKIGVTAVTWVEQSIKSPWPHSTAYILCKWVSLCHKNILFPINVFSCLVFRHLRWFVVWHDKTWLSKLFKETENMCSHSLWRHQMETFSALMAICLGNSPVTGEFPAQRPVTRSFDFFYVRLNKRLRKQSWGWWFETPSRPLWRHYKVPCESSSLKWSIYMKYHRKCIYFTQSMPGHQQPSY